MASDGLFFMKLVKRYHQNVIEFLHDDHVKKWIDEVVAKKTEPQGTEILRFNVHADDLANLLKHGFWLSHSWVGPEIYHF